MSVTFQERVLHFRSFDIDPKIFHVQIKVDKNFRGILS